MMSIAQTWKVSAREIVLRRDEADEMTLHRAAEPEDRAAEHEGLQPIEERVLAELDRRRLVLADAAQHASPGTADQPLQREVDGDRDRRDQRQVGEVERQRIRPAARRTGGG